MKDFSIKDLRVEEIAKQQHIDATNEEVEERLRNMRVDIDRARTKSGLMSVSESQKVSSHNKTSRNTLMNKISNN